MKKPPRGASCPERPFGMSFLGHRWMLRFWDKFGTGIKDQPYFRCLHCRRLRYPDD